MAKIGKQYGVHGNTGYLGASDTGEYLTELEGLSGILIYDEMRRSDAQIKAVLKAITLPILRNKYYIEPGTEDKKDVDIAEIIEKNLFEGMSITWHDVLRHIMLFKPFGYMPMEKVYEYDKDEGIIKLHKLDPRLPQSITKWNYVNKSLVSIEQVDTDGQQYIIPIEKLCIFTNQKEGSNWEGISALRAAYVHWFIKKDLLKIDIIKHNRHGVGILDATAPEGVDHNDAAWKKMDEILAAVHANEQGYVIKPSGWVIDILGGGKDKGTDVIKSIRYHDEMIALLLLAQFMKLGQTETGSRALGKEFIEFFLLALQEIAEYICQVINRFCIKELVDFNWKVSEYPKLKPEKIKELDYQALVSLVSTGIITKDFQIEKTIRERLCLPEINEEDYNDRHQNPFPEDKEKDDNNKAKDKDTNEKDLDKDKDDIKNTEYADKERKEKAESIPNFEFIDKKLDTTHKKVLDEILKIQDKQITYIAIKLSEGKTIIQITVPNKKDMFDLLHASSKEIYKTGQTDMRSEIVKQRPDLKNKLNYTEYGKGINEFMKWQDESLQIEVEGICNKLLAIMSKKASSIKKLNLMDFVDEKMKKELEEYARKDISQKSYEDMVDASVNVPYGEGRGNMAKKYDEYIDYLYRSALLDRNLCQVCRDKNNKEFKADTTNPDVVCPDPNCLGGKRCRCLIIAVMKEEKE